MKREIGYTDAGQIDERIATIEYTIWTSSLTLKEEKKLLAEIQDLKRTRPKVAHYHKMEEKVQNFDAGGNVKDQIRNQRGDGLPQGEEEGDSGEVPGARR